MNYEVLNQILNYVNSFFAIGMSNLKPYALSLLGLLITIDLVWAILSNLGSPDTMKILINKILKFGLLIFVINNYSWLLQQVLNGCVKLGLVAAKDGIQSQVLTNPSLILKHGARLSIPLLNEAKLLNPVAYLALMVNYFFMGNLIFLTFAFIAAQYVITLIEFNIFATLSLALIPFGGNKYTAFVAQKAVNGVVCFAVKIMVLAFLAGVSIPLFEKWSCPLPIKPETPLCILAGSLTLAFLSWHAPNVAASLMSGMPSLSANQMVSSAVNAGMQAYGAYTGAKTAEGVGINQTKQASNTGNTGGTTQGTIQGNNNSMQSGGGGGGQGQNSGSSSLASSSADQMVNRLKSDEQSSQSMGYQSSNDSNGNNHYASSGKESNPNNSSGANNNNGTQRS